MTTKYAELGFMVDSRGLLVADKRLESVTKSGEKTEKQIKSLDDSFVSLKGAVGLAAAALATIGASSNIIQVSKEFNREMSRLSAITGAAGKDLEFYRQQAALIGSTTTLSASQAVGAFKLIASAKPDLLANAQALAAVTREAVALSEASGGELQLTEAAKAVGGALNQFQMEASSASEVVNILAASAQQGTASIQQISESLVNTGAAANALNVSFVETVAGLQALARNNIMGAEAGTALNQVLLRLERSADATLMPSIVGLSTAIENLSAKNLSTTELMKFFGDEAFKAAAAVIAQKDTLTQLSSTLQGTSTAYEQASVQVDNLDGDLKSLSSVIESIAINLGNDLDPSLRSAAQSMTMILSNTEALGNAFEFLAFAGGSYATFMGGKYVASTLAAVSANQTQLASQAILDAGYKKSVAAKLAGDEAKIASELALTQVQRAAITQQILRTKSESTLTLLRAEQTRVTARMATAEAALSVASARTAAASGAATSASALATRALAAQTTSAMVTTGAMNALGVATRFALGPWGLLIGAIGAAATVFVTSKNQADQLNEIIEKQKGAVSGLADGYEKLNKVGQARYWQQSNSVLAENLNRLQQINAQISKNEQSMSTGDSSTRQVMREINERLSNEAQGLIAANDELRKTQQELFSKNMPSEWIDPSAGDDTNSATKEINKQLASLQQLQKEVGMTSDQLFVFREQQKSIANKDAEAVTQAIVRQAEAVVSLRNEIAASESAWQMAFTGTSDAVSEYDAWIDSMYRATNQAAILSQEIERVKYAMDLGDIDTKSGEDYIKKLQDQIADINKTASNPFEQMTSGAKEALSAMSGMFESGSKDAKKLAVAMSALNLVQAVGAVLNQGTGDPYTAFGRMASMAAMVASLGMSIGGLSGGFEDKSQAAQDAQGLNSWGDKSESIAKASEITASATDKLVGINTKMLSALRTMQQGILAASGLIARDVTIPNADMSGKVMDFNKFRIDPLENILPSFMTDFIGKALGGLLGGKSSVVNDGVRIVGGKINDLINSVTVQAFQDVKYKKWRFGSTKSHRELMDISSTVGGQISLVFESMRDSVAAGAETLGYSQSYIESAINNFKIATTEISLRGLSAEDQQKEIEAVFSSIFDNLAGSVIPFIDKFQIVGEGLGETLARVATQVAVTEEAALRFGITFGNKMANPEAFAMAADNLAMLTGGVDELASKVSSFTKFADEATQIEIAQNDLTRALSEVGLTLPDSTKGMWDLMSSLDGTTEAGREQIAALLNLQDSAMGYYQMLERQNDQYKNLSSSLRDIISNTYGLSRAASDASLDTALAAARLGDFSLALGGNFSGAMPSMSDFSSFADFAYEQAVTANKLEELAGLSDSQISVDERQLSELQKINQALRESYSPSASSNDTMKAKVESQSKDIEEMKYANQAIAESVARTARILDRIEGGGSIISVRVEA